MSRLGGGSVRRKGMDAKRLKELKRKEKALKRERRENQREKDRLEKEGQED